MAGRFFLGRSWGNRHCLHSIQSPLSYEYRLPLHPAVDFIGSRERTRIVHGGAALLSSSDPHNLTFLLSIPLELGNFCRHGGRALHSRRKGAFFLPLMEAAWPYFPLTRRFAPRGRSYPIYCLPREALCFAMGGANLLLREL